KAAGIELGKQRLHIAQDGRPCRGVADMADRDAAGQALDHLAPGEGVADETKPPFRMKPGSVIGYDAGGLLAAVLEGVEAKGGDGGGRGVAKNAEHAALFAQRVPFEVGL